MTESIRIPPEIVREKAKSGAALLVCAYNDSDKFKNNHLEGALSLDEFISRLPSMEKNQEIIFYCA
jgi:hypothetical protein